MKREGVNKKTSFEKPSLTRVNIDDDTRMDHSDITATSSKLPYKAAFPPNKGIKKKLWFARFFRFVYLFRYRHVI